MARAFLSHSSEDKAYVDTVARRLSRSRVVYAIERIVAESPPGRVFLPHDQPVNTGPFRMLERGGPFEDGGLGAPAAKFAGAL
jgi:hypothetical protein